MLAPVAATRESHSAKPNGSLDAGSGGYPGAGCRVWLTAGPPTAATPSSGTTGTICSRAAPPNSSLARGHYRFPAAATHSSRAAAPMRFSRCWPSSLLATGPARTIIPRLAIAVVELPATPVQRLLALVNITLLALVVLLEQAHWFFSH